MEPEEIDKLFKDRLAGLPAMPSVDAWQRLQQKMDPPKKERSLWIYYAAASVVILLVSGLLLIQTNTKNPGLANNTQREPNKSAKQNQAPLLIEKNKADIRLAEQSKQDNLEIKNNGFAKDIKPENTANNSIAANSLHKNTGKSLNKLPKESKNKSDYLAVNNENKNKVATSADYQDTEKTNSINADPTEFTLANNSQSASETALSASIVEVTVKKNYTDESAGDENGLRENLTKKTLLLKNIYKQARNLKNGEPVELTALGVDKEKLQSETKEIKQKINKVFSL